MVLMGQEEGEAPLLKSQKAHRQQNRGERGYLIDEHGGEGRDLLGTPISRQKEGREKRSFSHSPLREVRGGKKRNPLYRSRSLRGIFLGKR